MYVEEILVRHYHVMIAGLLDERGGLGRGEDIRWEIRQGGGNESEREGKLEGNRGRYSKV